MKEYRFLYDNDKLIDQHLLACFFQIIVLDLRSMRVLIIRDKRGNRFLKKNIGICFSCKCGNFLLSIRDINILLRRPLRHLEDRKITIEHSVKISKVHAEGLSHDTLVIVETDI